MIRNMARPMARPMARSLVVRPSGVTPELQPSGYRIALAGDSLFNPVTSQGTVSEQMHVAFGLSIYSGQRLQVVRPSGRDAFVFAVGGTDTDEFATGQTWAGLTVYQQTELLSKASEIDTVVVQIGANDLKEAVYDADTSFGRLESNVVAPLLAAGKYVVLQTAIPGSAALQPNGEIYSDLVAAWNARLIATYSNRPGVRVLNMREYYADAGTPGLENGAWGFGDGTHQPPIASMHNGMVIANLLLPFAPLDVKTAWQQGTPINENPYLTASGVRQLSAFAPANGGSISLAYADREDGEPGERWCDVTIGHAGQRIGSSTNGSVTYAVSGSNKVLVEHFAASTTTNPTLSVDVHTDPNGYKKVTVYPVATGLTIASTAAQVAAAVNAVPELSGILTATATGTGLDAVSFGSCATGEVRTPLSVADAVTVNAGEKVRAVFALKPSPGESFLVESMRAELRAGSTTIGSGGLKTWLGDRLIPEPITGDDEIVVASPWHTVLSGQSMFAIRAYFRGFGKFRIGRMMIQRQDT